MQYVTLSANRIYILRVDPGEDVLESVSEFIQKSGVRQAIVVGGYGTLTTYHIHWVKDNKLPTTNLFQKEEGGIEILSMNGLIVDGVPHIHVTLSTPKGALGGHLEKDCIAYVLCEIFIQEVNGIKLKREQATVSIEGLGEGKISRLTWTDY